MTRLGTSECLRAAGPRSLNDAKTLSRLARPRNVQGNEIGACIAALLLALPAAAVAQGALEYGSKPIRLVVPTAPGGGVDLTARIVAKGLADTSGLRIVVDGRFFLFSLMLLHGVISSSVWLSNGRCSIRFERNLPQARDQSYDGQA